MVPGSLACPVSNDARYSENTYFCFPLWVLPSGPPRSRACPIPAIAIVLRVLGHVSMELCRVSPWVSCRDKQGHCKRGMETKGELGMFHFRVLASRSMGGEKGGALREVLHTSATLTL